MIAMRVLSDRIRHAFRSKELRAYHLELEGPILIRYSGVGDQAALERLAALDSRPLPDGPFLLAEIDGDLVVAAPLDANAEPVSDPFRPTANLRELLQQQAELIRRHRGAGSADRGSRRASARDGALEDATVAGMG
jgi:hypothetical protein